MYVVIGSSRIVARALHHPDAKPDKVCANASANLMQTIAPEMTNVQQGWQESRRNEVVQLDVVAVDGAADDGAAGLPQPSLSLLRVAL